MGEDIGRYERNEVREGLVEVVEVLIPLHMCIGTRLTVYDRYLRLLELLSQNISPREPSLYSNGG